jgi:hypothetical protein
MVLTGLGLTYDSAGIDPKRVSPVRSGRISPLMADSRSNADHEVRHVRAGLGHSPPISRRISADGVLGTATSASWNVTYRLWRTTLTSFSRVVSDQCSTIFRRKRRKVRQAKLRSARLYKSSPQLHFSSTIEGTLTGARLLHTRREIGDADRLLPCNVPLVNENGHDRDKDRQDGKLQD